MWMGAGEVGDCEEDDVRGVADEARGGDCGRSSGECNASLIIEDSAASASLWDRGRGPCLLSLPAGDVDAAGTRLAIAENASLAMRDLLTSMPRGAAGGWVAYVVWGYES